MSGSSKKLKQRLAASSKRRRQRIEQKSQHSTPEARSPATSIVNRVKAAPSDSAADAIMERAIEILLDDDGYEGPARDRVAIDALRRCVDDDLRSVPGDVSLCKRLRQIPLTLSVTATQVETQLRMLLEMSQPYRQSGDSFLQFLTMVRS